MIAKEVHDDGEVMSEAQVATILDCEPQTIQEKARAGELPGLKFGRSWIFPRSALIERLHEMALANKPKPRPTPAAYALNIARGSGHRAPPPFLPDL